MILQESPWVEKCVGRPSAVPARRIDPRPGAAADRAAAEALLRDMALVFRATEAVRRAITGRK